MGTNLIPGKDQLQQLPRREVMRDWNKEKEEVMEQQGMYSGNTKWQDLALRIHERKDNMVQGKEEDMSAAENYASQIRLHIGYVSTRGIWNFSV